MSVVDLKSNADDDDEGEVVVVERKREKQIKVERSDRGLTTFSLSSIEQSTIRLVVRLDLSRNRLRELPGGMFHVLVGLEVLDVSRNQLRTIPSSIDCVSKLRELHLLSNKLNQRTFPIEACGKLKSLQLLDLRFNKKCNNVLVFNDILNDSLELRITPKKEKKKKKEEGRHACDRDATLLRSQLEPWSTPHLRRRLRDEFGLMTCPERDSRDVVMSTLLAQYHKRPRIIRREKAALPCPRVLYE